MKTFDIAGPLPSGTLVLEASAGTGKTSAIAGLAARFIAEQGIPLQKLMIATFSGASTREVRGRVRDELEAVERALSGSDPEPIGAVPRLLAADPKDRPERLGRIRAAIAGFDAATICTTHQFCDRMLAELGVLVDHDPKDVLVDDLSGLLAETVADEYLNRYADAHEPPFDLRTASLLGEFAAVRSPALPLAPVDAPGRAGERVSFAMAVRSEVDHRKHRLGIYTFDDMQLRLSAALSATQADRARDLLRERFPVVLIDEFQDTDPVQWEIVRRAFTGSSTVVLIGDPKQSIYGFRGADVYAYLSAVSEDVASLDTNHRSDPRVVRAILQLFHGAELGDPRIRVNEVATSSTAPRLVTDGPWLHPVRLRFGATESPAPAANAEIDADLVADITRLLTSKTVLHRPRQQCDRPLKAGDIAVIVSTNKRGQAVRTSLAQAGVPSVFNGSSSVLSSDAAEDWLTLLTAFTRPRTREVRAVSLTDFVGWSPAQLATADEGALGSLSQQVRTWHRIASDSGIAALFERMAAADGIYDRLLSQQGGDRSLTDLRHVADLLQAQQSRTGLGMAQLMTWLTDQRERGQASRDERSRRLETDADAVQVMTVHQAKGLQFPVVYLPEMSTLTSWRDTKYPPPFQFHRPTAAGASERCLDVGGPNVHGAAARRDSQELEEAGEQLRRLYVALTRAECHVTMWWIPTKLTPCAPLHRILFRDVTTPTVPLEIPVDARRPGDLRRLAGSGILLEPMGRAVPAAYRPALPALIDAARFNREVDPSWRRTSYSALTAGAHHDFLEDVQLTDEPPDPADAVPPESEADAVTTSPVNDALAAPSPMADLPGGTAFGSLVHAVFESYEPTSDSSLVEIVQRAMSRLPIPEVSAEDLAQAMRPAFETPLGPLFDGLRLRDLRTHDRLAELDFELPLGRDQARGPGTADGATIDELARLLRRHLRPGDRLADYPERLQGAGLSGDRLRGFLTGSIDAALRVGNRVVVVDYKTNRLAPRGVALTLGHYSATGMAEAMMESHYPLQALLYSVALHRFLRWRWRGYDPASQLGGVAYLFVRGMAGADTPVVDGMPTGVFSWRPPSALVTELSDLLAGLGGEHDRRGVA